MKIKQNIKVELTELVQRKRETIKGVIIVGAIPKLPRVMTREQAAARRKSRGF